MNLEYGGTRVSNETHTYVPAECQIRPLKDKIVIEPLDWEPSKLLNVVYFGHTLRGTVLAVGPGRYPLKYDGPKGRRSKSWESTQFRPNEVRVGDIVELGGLELRGYLFTSILWGMRKVILCSEQDVAVVHG